MYKQKHIARALLALKKMHFACNMITGTQILVKLSAFLLLNRKNRLQIF